MVETLGGPIAMFPDLMPMYVTRRPAGYSGALSVSDYGLIAIRSLLCQLLRQRAPTVRNHDLRIDQIALAHLTRRGRAGNLMLSCGTGGRGEQSSTSLQLPYLVS